VTLLTKNEIPVILAGYEDDGVIFEMISNLKPVV
jgi:hypothetical protein